MGPNPTKAEDTRLSAGYFHGFAFGVSVVHRREAEEIRNGTREQCIPNSRRFGSNMNHPRASQGHGLGFDLFLFMALT